MLAPALVVITAWWAVASVPRLHDETGNGVVSMCERTPAHAGNPHRDPKARRRAHGHSRGRRPRTSLEGKSGLVITEQLTENCRRRTVTSTLGPTCRRAA
ncbi:hypothetical protein GCM10009823_26320 [Brevibacterium salitolerans]|uniref:Secreted protein n=1 Tax=Brevibacterium salitolerans TaxID=1403566 RepID=A0ABN2X204_9MICO